MIARVKSFSADNTVVRRKIALAIEDRLEAIHFDDLSLQDLARTRLPVFLCLSTTKISSRSSLDPSAYLFSRLTGTGQPFKEDNGLGKRAHPPIGVALSAEATLILVERVTSAGTSRYHQQALFVRSRHRAHLGNEGA